MRRHLLTSLFVLWTIISGLSSDAQVLTDEERKIAYEASPVLPLILESGRDIWGEASMRVPNGPCYDFFARLLPPIRYVNTEFRHYPIVLSAPGSTGKARLVSNGSAVNARANVPVRWHDSSSPVTFRINGKEMFGEDLQRLNGPHYERGYLPVVQMSYTQDGSVYTEEAFACTSADLSVNGTVFLKFGVSSGSGGSISAEIGGEELLFQTGGMLWNRWGAAVFQFDRRWKWNPDKRSLTVALKPGQSAYLAVFTQPKLKSSISNLTESIYNAHRKDCIRTWDNLLSRSMYVETPEPIVNNAWRAQIIGSFMLLKGDDICYSAGNQYAKIYIMEGGDAVRSLLLWGYEDEARKMITPLLNFQRQGLLYHQAGLKLQMLSNYYWLTRDADFINKQQDQWMLQSKRVIDGRESDSGLFPREQYCGDIETYVYSLNSNANSWKGIRDMAAVLDDTGEKTESERMQKVADEFRPTILKAAEASIYKDVQPPFVPVALFGQEKPYDHLTATKEGGYWDLMAPLILGSGIFGDESEQTKWIVDYLQQRGGICMGMVRVHPRNPMYTVKQGVDDLYSLRYVLTLLRRDETDRALVSFYGKLAQGMTPDTFVDGETTGLVPLDKMGRPIYLPPNSAANAFYLIMLRYLMVQDWDVDDDGEPDTLRLMFATPRRWLEDGESVRIERSPTAFGEVSVHMRSKLSEGVVVAEVTTPPRKPNKTLLRARLPEEWTAINANIGNKQIPVDANGTIDISGINGKITVRFHVRNGKK